MKYYLIVGEASGDMHASNLMKALREEDPQAEFRFLGGDLMKSVGGKLIKHYREMAYMGIIPVVLHARTILRNMQMCKEDIRLWRPDVVILIDYPGFNLKIAKFVKTELSNIPVHYYISPKIWAWKKYRIKNIRRYVDRMFCILPFEREFYAGMEYAIDYVGNPSVDAVADYLSSHPSPPNLFPDEEELSGKPIMALLAGSRKQEIKENLPSMLAVAERFPEFFPVIAGAPGIDPSYYNTYIGDKKVRIVFGQTYPLLHNSRVAMVTSGTATLETCLFRVPQVVCYYVGGGRLVNFVFNRFFHTPFISLVNLIAGREVVQELFGARFSVEQIYNEVYRFVNHCAYRDLMMNGYEEVIDILGKPGASRRTAKLIVAAIKP